MTMGANKRGQQLKKKRLRLSCNICKRIDEALKEQHTECKVIQAVMRVIQPGHLKNMLICKDKMTITELKSFLPSQTGEKRTAELFQELVLARQLETETPQQFLYRMVGRLN